MMPDIATSLIPDLERVTARIAAIDAERAALHADEYGKLQKIVKALSVPVRRGPRKPKDAPALPGLADTVPLQGSGNGAEDTHVPSMAETTTAVVPTPSEANGGHTGMGRVGQHGGRR